MLLYKSFVRDFVRVRITLNICSHFWVLGFISGMICRVITNTWVKYFRNIVFLGSSSPLQNMYFEEMLYVCSKQGL